MPGFAFDAWIAPLSVKIDGDQLILGCPSSFHRDRVRNHFAPLILDSWRAAQSDSGSGASPSDSIELLTLKEFNAARGLAIEISLPARREVAAQSPLSRIAGSGVAACDENGASLVREMPALNLQAVSERKNHLQLFKSTGGAARRSARVATGTASVQTELPFSFESFVVGPCNALAREAALALARRRQRSLNQLYLGGGSGMGKTHLARAVATEARRQPLHEGSGRRTGRDLPRGVRADRSDKVVYTSAEMFTSEFVSAMRTGQSEDWKRRYRGAIDMLIVEDVQFFGGRTKTQLELFHTLQHVLDAGGSVLLTGDRAPRDLVGLDERMRDQVGRGFVAELELPDALVRRHILRSKAAAGGVHLPVDCLDLLVESSAGSVRDIESVLIQVVMTSSLLGRAIDLDLTQEAIALKSGAGSSIQPQTIAVSEIVLIVAAFFGKRPETLAGRSRRRDVLVPRQLAMYLSHRYTNASFSEIGHGLGRDHPSVRNAIDRVERLVLENAPLRYQLEALSERIDQTLKRPKR